MALGLSIFVIVALVLVAFAWSPIAVLVIVVLVLLGRFLYDLIGVGGERFFSGNGTHRHRHP